MLEYEEVVELCEARIKYCEDNRSKTESEGKRIEALTWGKATIELQNLYLDMLSRIKDKLAKENALMDQILQNGKESA